MLKIRVNHKSSCQPDSVTIGRSHVRAEPLWFENDFPTAETIATAKAFNEECKG
jgi:hypothetical protein